MKKIILLALSFLVLVLVNKEICTASDTEVATSGKCGKKITWSVDDNGVLTIEGTGEMYDYDDNNITSPNPAPWVKCSVKEVVIKEGITYIGRSAFELMEEITKVSLPNSLKGIGDSAFVCTALEEVDLPKGLTKLGECCFWECVSLKSIIIPDTVTKIPTQAFENCYSLKSVVLPKKLKKIDNFAFFQCESLESITISGGEIENSAFKSCKKLSEVKLLEGVTTIEDFAFYDCPKLDSLYIPSSVTRIGYRALGYKDSDSGYDFERKYPFTISTVEKSAAEVYALCNNITRKYVTDEKDVFIKSVTAKFKDVAYNGKAVTTPVIVKNSKNKTIPTSDYKVTYSSNKKVGTATIMVRGRNGYIGTVKTTFRIVPKKVELTSAKNVATKSIDVVWRKNVTGEGYEIQYSTDRNFKTGNKKVSVMQKSITKTTLKNLSKNTKYYVRIRAVKTIEGEKYCSSWSEPVTVNVKK